MATNKSLVLCALFCSITTNVLGVKPPKLRNPYAGTCFQNAAVQALFNIQPITNLLLISNENPNPYPMNTPEEAIAHLYTALITQIHKQLPESTAHYLLLEQLNKYGYCQVGQNAPMSLLDASEKFKRGAQEDSSEFLGALINSLMSSNPTYKDLTQEELLIQSPIGKILAIKEAITISCNAIDYEGEVKIRPLSTLNLDVRTLKTENGLLKETLFTTLAQCLAHHFTTEIGIEYRINLTEHQKTLATPKLLEAIKDPNPARQDCTKTVRLASTSDVVIITLNRSIFDNISQQQIKINHPVEIPNHINFIPYMTSEAARISQPNYELIGTILHIGAGAGVGHYVAYVKVKDPNTPHQWYRCDDENIQPTTWPQVQSSINRSYVAIYQNIGLKPSQPIQPSASVQPSSVQTNDLIVALKKLQDSLEVLNKAL